MSKFHISANGDPGPCKAKEGGCPFGEDAPHFDTQDEAREHYEKTQSENSIPVKLSGKEYSALAKTSSNSEELMSVALKAPDGSLKVLANNPKAPEEVILTAYSRAKKDETKALLETSKNFPTKLMTPAGLQALHKASPYECSKRMASDDISYENIAGLRDLEPTSSRAGSSGSIGGASNSLDRVVSNPDNKLTAEELVEITKDSKSLTNAAIARNKKYPTYEIIDTLDNDSLVTAAISSHDSRAVNAATSRLLKDTVKNASAISRAASSTKIGTSTLAKIAESSNDKEALIAVYNNPSSSEQTKSLLSKKDKTVASLSRLDALDKRFPGSIEELSKGEVSVKNFKRSIQLDPVKIKAAGLDKQDVDAMIRYRKNDFLFHAEYDENAGLYTGHIS